MHAVMWGVWKEITRRFFDEKFTSNGEVIDSIVRDMVSWLFVLDEFKDLPLSLFLRYCFFCLQWAHTRREIEMWLWVPPHVGCFKLNFDGASKGNPGKAGFGCVLWDHDHNVILVTYSLLGVCNAIKTKAISLLMGLREFDRFRLKGCKVEGDSAVVISWGLGNCIGSWDLVPIIYEIRELISVLSICLFHVDRSWNELADKLANWGVNFLLVYSENCLPAGCS